MSSASEHWTILGAITANLIRFVNNVIKRLYTINQKLDFLAWFSNTTSLFPPIWYLAYLYYVRKLSVIIN
jgi:hypothetical protein